MTDTTRRRTGPKPLEPELKRGHCVSVRMNPAELAWLDSSREPVQMQRGEYLRDAAMGRLPVSIPAINREAWISLSRSASNLNQLVKGLNQAGFSDLDVNSIQSALADFRKTLIGASIRADKDDSE